MCVCACVLMYTIVLLSRRTVNSFITWVDSEAVILNILYKFCWQGINTSDISMGKIKTALKSYNELHRLKFECTNGTFLLP